MCLQFGFEIFWQKDFGAKAAHKMLVKLTPGGSMGIRYVLKILFISDLVIWDLVILDSVTVY
jgi:hypothetical protein